jgi:SNF2 family DNA or RNA helicase
MGLHAFNQRILAEELVRIRRPEDRERYAAVQRQARIDPNPHQIDAVICALRRLREGGYILADEVGLGKTIEAGLVIAQSRAERRTRSSKLLNLKMRQKEAHLCPRLIPGSYRNSHA